MPRIDLSPYDEWLQELTRERYAPVLSPPKRRQPRARQVMADPERPGARPTGTGWPA